MSPWTLYWILQVDSIKAVFTTFCAIIGTFGGIALIIGGIWMTLAMEDTDERSFKAAKRFLKWSMSVCVPFVLFLSLISAFLPSTKQAATIYLLPRIVNNVEVQNTANDAMRLLMYKVNSYLREEMQNNIKLDPPINK